jgi:K+-transporting ATPase ATPase C chain
MLVMLTLITSVLYPLAITLAAQFMFPAQANGSLVTVDGTVVGSELIGQANDAPRYFWSRPSAVSYNPLPSGGSNLSRTDHRLVEAVAQREADFRAANNLLDDVAIPPEMLYASGSGLDPHISPEAARLQINRVAESRNLPRETISELVDQYVEPPQLGFLGQPRVNVLRLNLALDRLQ